jgi:uncharacterized Fe-S center protein
MRSKKTEQTTYAKIQRLFDVASIGDSITKGDLVAVKVHIGTGQNHRHLRPQHIRAVVDKIKEVGGEPFVTETTGIGLAASRGTAIGCIRTAISHGFTTETLGAPVIIADGLKGLSGIKIMANGMRFKEVEIGQAIAESDAMISVSHAKGHARTGFAASLKNIGIGCVTKPYKGQSHLALKPNIDQEKCNNCGVCVDFCPVEAIQRTNGKPQVIEEKCIWGCGCWDICPQKAFLKWNDMHHRQNKELIIRNVDAAVAVLNHFGREKLGFINLAYDITPHCDCADYGDVPMVPDIGIFASRDPIAIDKATSDKIISSPGILGSAAEEVNSMKSGDDKFSKLSEWEPFKIFKTDDMTREWRAQLEIGEKLGLGTQKYDLINVDQ